MNEQPHEFELDKPMELVGTAVSDWQVNPLKRDGTDCRSDWGDELVRKIDGKRSGIHGTSRPELLPRFDLNYKSMFGRAKEVGSNAFRLSLDFGRLCPDEGVFDEELMKHYIRIMVRCRYLGMEPVVTLHHWTYPKSFCKYDRKGNIVGGGLEHPGIVNHFSFYVNKIADFLCDSKRVKDAIRNEGYDFPFVQCICDDRLLARWFVSLNEPINLLAMSYIAGKLPPYQKVRFDKMEGLEVKLKEMHRITHDVFHDDEERLFPANKAHVKVGMAHQLYPNNIPVFDRYMSHGLLERMETGVDSDFLGIQFYCRVRIALAGLLPTVKGPDPRFHSDHPSFAQVYPEGIYEILKKVNQMKPYKEIYVTEIGFADKTDKKRPSWILETVRHLLRAKREGVPVKGLLIWSLINNFEWCHGMDTPFGLFDHNGERLASDNDECLSSRHVWQQISGHLRDPKPESARRLSQLSAEAAEQLESAVNRNGPVAP
jgi:beta-glucosidase